MDTKVHLIYLTLLHSIGEFIMDSQFDTGMGTTPGMWEMVSEALKGEKLPESINKAIQALCGGTASVISDVNNIEETSIGGDIVLLP